MIPTLRTFWIIAIVGIFLIGLSGCGEKHLEVSTSSGKSEQPGELGATGPETGSDQTGIQDSSLSESGLGNQGTLKPSSEGLDDSATGSQTDSSNEASQHAQGLIATEPREGIHDPSTSNSAMKPLSEQEDSISGLPDVPEEAPLVALGSPESDEDPESGGSSLEEEIAALALSTQEQAGLKESPSVERIPENIAIAKTEPSSGIEEQLARIKEEELATAAAGLQDVFFEFDSWSITEDGKDVLEKSADWLQEDSASHLVIEGHVEVEWGWSDFCCFCRVVPLDIRLMLVSPDFCCFCW